MKHDHGNDGLAKPASVAHRAGTCSITPVRAKSVVVDISSIRTITITMARWTRRIPRMGWSPLSAAAR